MEKLARALMSVAFLGVMLFGEGGGGQCGGGGICAFSEGGGSQCGGSG